MRRFPALLEAVAGGELHLTGLLLLGPHLTERNLAGVLARARHRTKKEITRLVRELDPLPDIPARIEPLGPAPAGLVPPTGTWQALVQSLCPVRELQPGDRPRDWTSPVDESDGAQAAREEPGARGQPARTRAGAGATFPQLSGARCSSGTAGVAPTSMRRASVAVRVVFSSCITWKPSPGAAGTAPATSPCDAELTIRWPPNRTSAETSSSTRGMRSRTSRSRFRAAARLLGEAVLGAL